MAIFHSTTQIIGRSSGRSSVAAAAYRAGSNLTNEREGITHDYSRKTGVVHSEIMLPDNAPVTFRERATLWNAVEKAEKRKDAQVAREIEIALPEEFNRQEQIKILREYIQNNFVARGMCADFSIHDKGYGNPHVHIMLTTREIGNDGFGNKERSWNDWANVEQWRESWANICNRELERKGLKDRIDHRSFQEQGVEREPTIHLGTSANRLEKMGIHTRLGDYNREVAARNQEYTRSLEALQSMKRELQERPELHRTVRMPDRAEQSAARMGDLKAKYLSQDGQIRELEEKSGKLYKLNSEVETRQGRITEYSKKIDSAQSSIDELERQRDSLGMFKGREKKELDERISIFKHSRDQAADGLRRECGIERSQVLEERQKLGQQSEMLRKQIDEIKPKLNALEKEQRQTAFEYKREKAIMQLSMGREKAEVLLRGRSIEPRSMEERISLEKLDSISRSDYKNIMPTLEPGMAKQLEDSLQIAERTISRGLELIH